jgi:hypothetical protein
MKYIAAIETELHFMELVAKTFESSISSVQGLGEH